MQVNEPPPSRYIDRVFELREDENWVDWFSRNDKAHIQAMHEWIEKGWFISLTAAFCDNFDTSGSSKWITLLSGELIRHDRSKELKKWLYAEFSGWGLKFEQRLLRVRNGKTRQPLRQTPRA